MNRLDYVKELRKMTDVHWNCCQSVVAAFCPQCGITEEQAYRMGAHFAAGMKMGSTCGVIVGGLMVLGMLNADDAAVQAYKNHFRTQRSATTCPELLKIYMDNGGTDRKPHCDALVFEAVETLAELTGIEL